jgi:hypothetical protein
MRPGPLGTREDALAILRKYGEIVAGPPGHMGEGTRIVSAEWNDDWRRWVVELQTPNGASIKLSVDVPGDSYESLLPDEIR